MNVDLPPPLILLRREIFNESWAAIWLDCDGACHV